MQHINVELRHISIYRSYTKEDCTVYFQGTRLQHRECTHVPHRLGSCPTVPWWAESACHVEALLPHTVGVNVCRMAMQPSWQAVVGWEGQRHHRCSSARTWITHNNQVYAEEAPHKAVVRSSAKSVRVEPFYTRISNSGQHQCYRSPNWCWFSLFR